MMVILNYFSGKEYNSISLGGVICCSCIFLISNIFPCLIIFLDCVGVCALNSHPT